MGNKGKIMVDKKTYEQGVIEGEIKTLTELGITQTSRINDHSKRLRILEKAMWVTAGIVLFVQLSPAVKSLLSNGVVQ